MSCWLQTRACLAACEHASDAAELVCVCIGDCACVREPCARVHACMRACGSGKGGEGGGAWGSGGDRQNCSRVAILAAGEDRRVEIARSARIVTEMTRVSRAPRRRRSAPSALPRRPIAPKRLVEHSSNAAGTAAQITFPAATNEAAADAVQRGGTDGGTGGAGWAHIMFITAKNELVSERKGKSSTPKCMQKKPAAAHRQSSAPPRSVQHTTSSPTWRTAWRAPRTVRASDLRDMIGFTRACGNACVMCVRASVSACMCYVRGWVGGRVRYVRACGFV
jgi:hypothetical protein